MSVLRVVWFLITNVPTVFGIIADITKFFSGIKGAAKGEPADPKQAAKELKQAIEESRNHFSDKLVHIRERIDR